MIKPRLTVAAVLLCMICNTAWAQDTLSDIVPDTAHPVLISTQFAFTEGPAADKKGNIFFTDQPNDQIWKYDVNGKLSLYMNKTGRANGLYFDHKGNIISCSDEHDELWQISPQKKVTVLMHDYQGHQLNGPNDLWIDAKGGIYFTDPYYQRDYWTRQQPDIEGMKVYYLAPGKKEPIVVADDITKPNGIVGTRDGHYLYVADIGGDKTYRYRIQPDGSLTARELFAEKGADGITLDDKGDLYLCGNGVTVYNEKGKKLGHIDIPGQWSANACFGGPHKDVLFITSSKKIFILKMKVHGIE
jgi:gluconolactonase